MTGVEKDFYGRVIGLKIVNSYGEGIGQKGIMHMSKEFTSEFLFDVVYVGNSADILN